jgi:cell division transport system permease protein
MRANFIFSEVLTGLRRNLTMTVAMIITTAISLGFFGAGLLVRTEIDKMKEIYFDKLQVSVYLKEDIKQADRDKLQQSLSASPEVKNVEYLTKDQAYQRYRRLFQQNPGLVSLAGPNDFPPSFVVVLKHPERYAVIQQGFAGSPGVDEVSSQNVILDRIFNLFSKVRLAALVIALIQLFAALLLISNTIQVAAFHRRTETSIMRLVGASRWYTQLPFILEAALAGLIGGVLATVGLLASKVMFVDRALAEPIRSGTIAALNYGDILWPTGPLVLVIGVVMASVAAYVTLRLYVRL